MPRAHFLGTNGWYDSATGKTVCMLIEYPDLNVVLDAGGGFADLDAHIDLGKPTYLFLSHLHLDHIGGLHTLPKYLFQHDLTVMLAEGSVPAFRSFLNLPYTAPADQFKPFLGYDICVVALPATPDAFPFSLSTRPVVHTVETHAVRIEAAGTTLAYVPDTGYCPNAVEIAKSADLLICECSHRPGETNEAWPHLNPQEAARIARESSCRRMVLTHFDARRYPTTAHRDEAVRVARDLFANTAAASDGLTLDF